MPERSKIQPYWCPAPSPPAPLREGVVDVWRVELPGGPPRGRGTSRGSGLPRESAPPCGRGTPRGSAAGILRALLGDYLGRPAQELRFVSGAHGKPALASGAGVAPGAMAPGGKEPAGEAPAVSFNLSHSGPLVLLAFTAGSAQVGIDVEVADTKVADTSNTRARARDEPALAARLWGAEQARRLRALPQRERAQEFLRLWTAHEAALKCTGAGLSGAAAAAAQDPPAAAALWVAEILLGGEHAAAAVAVEQVPTELRFWSAPA